MMTRQHTTNPLKFAAFAITWTISITAVTSSATLPAQDSTPPVVLSERFTSKEGGFSILFPDKPEHKQGTIITGTLFDTNRQTIVEERFISGTKEAAFVVMYQESSEANGKSVAQILELLETKTNEFVEVSDGLIQKKEAIQIDVNVPAYKFTLAEPEKDGGGQMLTFFNDGKFYRIGAFGSRQFIGSPTARQFLDSLQLLNRPSTKSAPPTPLQQQNDVNAFVSRDAGFQISFPTVPKISVEDLTDDNGRAFVQTQFVSSVDDGAYLVSVQGCDESSFQTAALRKTGFDATRDRLVAAFSGKILEDRDIKMEAEIPARELRISIPGNDGTYHTRIFFSNSRFYQVTALGSSEFERSDETQRIMNSFRLLPVAAEKESTGNLTSFESEFGRFKIKVAVKPVYSRATVNVDDDTKLVRHQYISGQRPEAVFVTFIDLPVGVTAPDGSSADFFQTVASSLAEEFDGELSTLERIESTFSKNVWKFRIAGKKPDDNVQGRLFVQQGRFYQLLAVGHADFAGGVNAETILNSFNTMPVD